MKKNLILFVLILPFLIKAQVPSILKDLSPGSASTTVVELYTLPNNDVLFSASTNSLSTTGLYVSDGSTAGTKILKSFGNGKNLGGTNFVLYNGKIYLNADYSYTAAPLWRTDGTNAGTDSVPIQGLTSAGLNGIRTMSVFINLIFIEGYGNKLWRSDGTSAGSYSIAADVANPYYIQTVNGILYFSATSSVTGTELWRTDGTAAGTFMLKDIWPGTQGSGPIYCGKNSSLLFFTANNQINGSELWKTDGTVNGTSMIKDIYPGAISSAISSQSAWSGSNGLYFIATSTQSNTDVWFTDGTSVNTYSLINASGGYGLPRIPVFVGNNAYFLAPSNNAVYKTNGTVAGTSSISAIGSVANPSISSENVLARSLMIYNNDLYYLTIRNNSGADSICLRKVDLNLNSKSMVLKLFRPNTTIQNTWLSIYDMNAIVANNHFLFFLGLGSGTSPELLVFNPVSNQSRRFLVFAGNKEFYKTQDYVVNNKFYLPFQTNNYGPGYLDLATDSLVSLVNPNSGIGFSCSNAPMLGLSNWNPCLYKLNNKFNFLCQDPNYGVEFYETDFTKANTHLVKDVYPGVNPYFPPNSNCGFQNVWGTPNNIYFLGNDGVNGFELWSFINAPNNPQGIQKDTKYASDVSIYPNPSSGEFVIQSNDAILSVKLYNAIGSVLKTESFEGSIKSFDLNLAAFDNGIYIAEIITKSGKTTKKLIKQ